MTVQERVDSIRMISKIVCETIGTESVPESYIYLALGCNLSNWQALRGIMLDAGLIQIRHNLVSLTPDGVKFGAE